MMYVAFNASTNSNKAWALFTSVVGAVRLTSSTKVIMRICQIK